MDLKTILSLTPVRMATANPMAFLLQKVIIVIMHFAKTEKSNLEK